MGHIIHDIGISDILILTLILYAMMDFLYTNATTCHPNVLSESGTLTPQHLR